MLTKRPIVPLVLCCAITASSFGNPALKPGVNQTPDAPLARLGSDRFRAAGTVAAIAFSPDGSQLVALAEHGMSIWDALNGREVRFQSWRYAHPRLVTWPKKGQPLAALDPANDSVYLWAFADEKATLPRTALGEDPDDEVVEPPARFSHVAISSDGTRVAAADSDAKSPSPIRLWDTVAGKRLSEIKPFRSIDVGEGGWTDFGLSPDGKVLLVFGPEAKVDRMRLTLFDLETGKERKRLIVPSLATNEQSRHTFAISDDGRLLALARPDTTTVVVDLAGSQEPQVLGRGAGVVERDRLIAISPDGKYVATDLFGAVIVWDVARGRQIPNLKQVEGLVAAIAFSSDGKRLARASRSGLVEVWSTETWEPAIRAGGHTDRVDAIAVTHDGKTAITTSLDRTMRTWEVHNGVEVRAINLDSSPDSVHLAPDGRTVLISAFRLGRERGKFGTGFIRMDLTGRSERVDGALGEGLDEEWPKSRFAGFAADGRTFLSWRQRTMTMWDWPAGTKRRSIDVTLEGNWNGELSCEHARLSNDGRLIAASFEHEERKDFGRVVSSAGTCVVEAATGKHLWRISSPEIWYASVAFTPDSKRLIVGGRGDLKGDEFNNERISLAMFDASTGTPLRRFRLPDSIGNRREVEALAVSLDGRTVAVGEGDHSITVYELATGDIRQRLVGHRTTLKDLVAGPNGRLFSVAWNDSFAFVWATNPAAAAQHSRIDEAAFETEWRKRREPDAKSAFQAMVRMAGDPTATAKHIQKNLKPTTSVDAKSLDKVFADLDADAISVREKATQMLDEFGRVAVQASRARLQTIRSEEVKSRLTQFIERQEREELNSEELRAFRAVELLESLGSEEARKVLEQLAKGERSAWLTIESTRALSRLKSKRVE